MITVIDKNGNVIDKYNDQQHLYDSMLHKIAEIQLNHKSELTTEYKKGCSVGIMTTIAVLMALAAIGYIFQR